MYRRLQNPVSLANKVKEKWGKELEMSLINSRLGIFKASQSKYDKGICLENEYVIVYDT